MNYQDRKNTLENIAADPQGLHNVHCPWEHQGLTAQYTFTMPELRYYPANLEWRA